MKLSEVIDCNGSLVALKDNTTIPVGVGYVLALNVKMFQPYVEQYVQSRNDLLDQYAKRDEDGKSLEENGEILLTDREAYFKDLKALHEQDCPVTPMQFKLADLGQATIAPGHIVNLLPLIHNPEDK